MGIINFIQVLPFSDQTGFRQSTKIKNSIYYTLLILWSSTGKYQKRRVGGVEEGDGETSGCPDVAIKHKLSHFDVEF